MRGLTRRAVAGMCAAAFVYTASGQTLTFESGGLKYHALTRAGVTVMVAPLPTRILGYAILQVAVSNGSVELQQVLPEKFQFRPTVGKTVQAISANAVVNDVLDRAGRGDVGRLIGVYENALFGNSNLELRHGYEARRKDAMAIGGGKMRAAAAAAAIVLGSGKLEPGQSTDGAVFFPTGNKPLGAGTLVLQAAGETFEFTFAPEPAPVR
ncbi:MAG: hypothetical protein ABIR70_11245 [Bryobacteraceae bacterium]